VQNLTENPAKMAAAAAQYTQPLSAGLTSSISNLVQGNLAERGLGSSPAAYAQLLSQSLAPYIMQNQQVGLNTLLQSLATAAGTRTTPFPQIDISRLLATLKAPTTPGSLSNLQPEPDVLNIAGPNPNFGPDTTNIDLSGLADWLPQAPEPAEAGQ
jgi:hypothetical protein